MRHRAVHTLVRVGHALASKIYLLAHGGRTEKQLMAERIRESLDHSGMARVAVGLLEVDISNFEKN
jgi:hypothetical protein